MALADLLVRIGVDTNDFSQGLKRFSSDANAASASVAGALDAATGKAAASSAEAAAAFTKQKNELKELGRQYAEGSISAKQFLDSAGNSVDLSKSATAAAKLDAEIDSLTKRFERGRISAAQYQSRLGELKQAQDEAAASASKAKSKIGDFAKIGDSFKSLGIGLTASITAPLLALGAGAVKSAADLDSLTRGLNAVNKSGKPTAEILERLRDVAKLPGLGFQEAVRGSINLQAAGFSAAQSEKSLRAFGNALATVGKGKADLDGVNLALAQIASKGKISAEELNQLAERVPQIREAVKAAYGTADTEKLQKLGIDAKEFVERISDELLKLPQVTGGVANAFENLSDQLTNSLAAVGKALLPAVEAATGQLAAILKGVEDAAKGFGGLPGPTQNAAIAVAGYAAALGPVLIVVGSVISNLKLLTAEFGLSFAAASRFAGIGALFVAGASSFFDYARAAFDASKANGDLFNATERLEKQTVFFAAQLERSGVVVSGVRKAYEDKTITLEQYADALQYSARQFAPNLKGLDAQKTKAEAANKAIADQTSKLLALANGFDGTAEGAKKFTKEAAKLLDLSKAGTETAKFTDSIKDLVTTIKKGDVDLVELQAKLGAIKAAHEAAAQGTAAHRRELEKMSVEAQRLSIIESERSESIRQGADIIRQFERGLNPRLETGQLQQQINQLKSGILGFTVPIELVPVVRELESPNADLQRALSVVSNSDAVKRNIANIKSLGAAYKTAGGVGKRAMQEVSTVLTNLSQGIGQAIFSGEKFGEVFVRIGKQIGASITSFIIQELLKASGILEGFSRLLSGVIKNIAGGVAGGAVGSAAGSIGGSVVGSAAGSAVGSAAGGAAGSAAGGAAGGAASGAASSVFSIVGAVGSVVSAISGIIGNFQTAETNKTLDRIVLHTLQTANDLANLRRDQFDFKAQMLSKIDDVFKFTWVKLDELTIATRSIGSIPVNAAVSGGGTVNNFVLSSMVPPTDTAAWFDWFAAELRRRRLIN